MDYIPVSEREKQEMLESIGVKDSSELFKNIPETAILKQLNLKPGISEHKLVMAFEALSKKNSSLKDLTSFRGAGIYDHFIPSLVEEVTGRSEFTTAYTPYQPEASQGTLQTIFEYQSLMAELTGMDVANASLYDGASATAEAALLAIRATKRNKIIVSSAVHPEYRQVLQTYLSGTTNEIITAPIENTYTSVPETKPLLNTAVAAIIIQSPNFFGTIENLAEFRTLTKEAGILLLVVTNPVSLGILKSPGEIGADITVGEGQVLGNPTGFGGFAFGFLACKKSLTWKTPGRIVGQTTDTQGRRGYVLTLQSREQHIKREKATSNICTNSALNALAGCVYMAGWGEQGIKKLAEANLQKSHYAYERLCKVPGFTPAFPNQVFFNEFVLKTTKDISQLQKKLLSEKILGPLELGDFYPEFGDCLLFCVTETRTKDEIDKLVDVLSEQQ